MTKIKEKLENFLSQSNNLIRISDKIKKGISKLENNNKHNNIQNASYISKINQIQKEIDILNYETMENFKINFIDEKSNLNYEKYYFNGIPIPNNITINNITSSNFKISWKIDEPDNEIQDKIKFRLEIKKENDNFNKIYEGNQNNFNCEGLSSNTNYEIRICSFFENYNSPYGEITKVKTMSPPISNGDKKKGYGNLFG